MQSAGRSHNGVVVSPLSTVGSRSGVVVRQLVSPSLSLSLCPSLSLPLLAPSLFADLCFHSFCSFSLASLSLCLCFPFLLLLSLPSLSILSLPFLQACPIETSLIPIAFSLFLFLTFLFPSRLNLSLFKPSRLPASSSFLPGAPPSGALAELQRRSLP